MLPNPLLRQTVRQLKIRHSSDKVWQYGETQVTAQSLNPTGASALANSSATLTLSGSNFSYNFPAYSMTVLDLTPAPTVATAAAASPSAIMGVSTVLSVLGACNGGESTLTDAWATTGTPPAPVTFSSNGTNSAKNVTATFTKAGSYSFTVTVADPSGVTTSSSTNVTVNQKLTSINSTTVFSAGSQLTISGNVSGSGCSLTVNGPGTVVLRGANSYTGGTIILSGTLIFANATALPDESSLIIGAGGTLVFGPTLKMAGGRLSHVNTTNGY